MTDKAELRQLIEAVDLGSYFSYDEVSGLLYWRERTPDMFEDGSKTKEHMCSWWNSRYAGKQAFTAKKDSGYYGGPLGGKSVMAHRVVWALLNGAWPQGDLDHINGDRLDNRIDNLRLVDSSINAMNRRPNKGKSSGLPHGVSIKRNGRIFAQVQKNGKNKHLGYFDTVEAAHTAYTEAKRSMGFHENHGKILKAYEAQQ